MFSILQKYKVLTKWLGIEPLNEKNHLNRINAMLYMMLKSIIFALASGTFYLEIHDNDVIKASKTGVGICGSIISFAYYAHMMLSRRRFNSLRTEINDIVNERIRLKRTERFYVDIESQFDKYADIAVKGSSLMACPLCAPFLIAGYMWIRGQYSTDAWIYLYDFRLPFELNTTGRCLAMGFLQMSVLFYGSFSICTGLIFLYGVVSYVGAFLMDIKSLFDRIDKLTKSHEAETMRFGFCKEAIDLHVRTLSCVRKLADIMNVLLLVTLFPCVFTLAVGLYSIEKTEDGSDWDRWQMAVVAISFPIEILFITFYLGQKLHSNLMELRDSIYRSDWHLYSRSAQYCVLVMMILAQRPFFISAYGLLPCNLENFVVVIKAAYSALMLLRGAE